MASSPVDQVNASADSRHQDENEGPGPATQRFGGGVGRSATERPTRMNQLRGRLVPIAEQLCFHAGGPGKHDVMLQVQMVQQRRLQHAQLTAEMWTNFRNVAPIRTGRLLADTVQFGQRMVVLMNQVFEDVL